MRPTRLVLAAMLVVTCAADTAGAQTVDRLSPLQLSIACAPPASGDGTAPAAAPRIIGSQDVVPRSLFGDRDLLVLGGGTGAGVQLGQQFFVRRTIRFGASPRGRGAKTLGWVRVVAVNESTAIATVDHACSGMEADDYLEPFVAPELPAEAGRDEARGEPDFATLGHIVVGAEDRRMVGVGDFALIDWGQAQGLAAGARFAIYRDVGVNGLPLAGIGEGVVIAAGPSTALTRITRARDAVYTGDYIALRK